MKKILLMISLISVFIFSAGCIRIEQKILFYPDGSGEILFDYSLDMKKALENSIRATGRAAQMSEEEIENQIEKEVSQMMLQLKEGLPPEAVAQIKEEIEKLSRNFSNNNVKVEMDEIKFEETRMSGRVWMGFNRIGDIMELQKGQESLYGLGNIQRGTIEFRKRGDLYTFKYAMPSRPSKGEWNETMEQMLKEFAKGSGFKFILYMPGEIIETNAANFKENQAVWEFDLKDMLKETILLLSAKSKGGARLTPLRKGAKEKVAKLKRRKIILREEKRPELSLLRREINPGLKDEASLEIGNSGQALLNWRIPPLKGLSFLPSSGKLGAGEKAKIKISLDRKEFSPGDYSLPFPILSDEGREESTLSFTVLNEVRSEEGHLLYRYKAKENGIEVVEIEESLFTLYHQTPIYTNLILPLKVKELLANKTYRILINLPRKPSFISTYGLLNDLVLLKAKAGEEDSFKLSLKVIDEKGEVFTFRGRDEIREKLNSKAGKRINQIILEITPLQETTSDVEIGFSLANLNHTDPEELTGLLEKGLKEVKPIEGGRQ